MNLLYVYARHQAGFSYRLTAPPIAWLNHHTGGPGTVTQIY
ncbi:hypothetical protein DAQ1742_00333 [Dickeya aquatica]|uniref:Uncharacterized protein n=1 Tax=Dickeya aquatica TaxID=1401087 RepID=A0A375A633_9GAMM|nr:hypothetical protein DAQ1742_00333 [Dickeya aquatica]